MSTWRRRFSKRSPKLSENNQNLLTNSGKYRKKLQAAIAQINRTKKTAQRNLDSSDSEIHVARLINDIGQLSDSTPLQEISSLIDSLAMRHQLSSRIFNEYAMNALEQSLEKLNNNLSNDFDQSKSVFEESVRNHCSDRTKSQLFQKVQNEWSKHQNLAVKEFKQSLSSYCDIGLYNLKIQMAIFEKLQNFTDQLPPDGTDTNLGLPNFATNSVQTRKEIDTMLRMMLDRAPNDPGSLPNAKRPKFLNSLYSAEITEAAARSQENDTLCQQIIPQYPSMIPSTSAASAQIPSHESVMVTPTTPIVNDDDDRLPSYTDLFVVPSSCKDARSQRRSSRFNN